MAKKRAHPEPDDRPVLRGQGSPAVHQAAAGCTTLATSGSARSGPARSDSGPPPRPVIERVRPVVDAGRFAAKACVGDPVIVEADVFADSHDLLDCRIRWRHQADERWQTVAMAPLGNDRWRARFRPQRLGLHQFEVHGAVDDVATWRRDLAVKLEAGADVEGDLRLGAALLRTASSRAEGDEAEVLDRLADQLDAGTVSGAPAGPSGALLDEAVAVARHTLPTAAIVRSGPYPVMVEPPLARFGTWYELFPRSASPDPDRPGNLADVIARLPYLARLGVDVLYLPPIHPIGTTNRKGRDGATTAGPGDPGSPWAIGSPLGGHDAVDPGLGTVDDVDRLVTEAGAVGIAVALDLAFQCSPDHPWVTDHPGWFRHLPDGTIRYAENPPKRYEDIYPLDFGCEDWSGLWAALLDVVRFWIGHGVRVFRVDNPHTKPFAFWEWLLDRVRQEHPEVIVLAEAFTRPAVLQHLAKLGFSQSYTYFAWRTAKWELESYLTELALTEVADYLRPNLWPNTPDILTEQLQEGGTAGFVIRLVLAATLSASYGIYGPAFELGEHRARQAGSEEYRHSEKYEVRHWDLDRADSLADLVARVNAIRRAVPALQYNHTLRFHPVDNDQLIAYSKSVPAAAGDPAGGDAPPADVVLVVVNLDPAHAQSGWVDVDATALGFDAGQPLSAHDLLTDAYFDWRAGRNFVRLDPLAVPAHLLLLEPAGRR